MREGNVTRQSQPVFWVEHESSLSQLAEYGKREVFQLLETVFHMELTLLLALEAIVVISPRNAVRPLSKG